MINLPSSRYIGLHKGWAGLLCNLLLINNLSTPQQFLKRLKLASSTCHPMLFGFNLLHSIPGTALISNENIIPLLVKTPVSNALATAYLLYPS